MGKKNKKKYSKKQIIIYSIVFVGIIALGFFADKKKEDNNAEEINSGNFNAYGIVEKLKPRSMKGSYTSRKDVVYLYYKKNDTIFHIIENLPDGQIEKLEIKLNDCFLVKIAESDNDIFNIDFTKKMDTLVDKDNYQHQVYKTEIHKKIIE